MKSSFLFLNHLLLTNWIVNPFSVPTTTSIVTSTKTPAAAGFYQLDGNSRSTITTATGKNHVSKTQRIQVRIHALPDDSPIVDDSRRTFLSTVGRKVCAAAVAIGSTGAFPKSVIAKPDCMSDCLKNCKLIAPKDPAYCLENCKFYCSQDDRKDGLSGSVSSAGGEVGILGINTVVKGDDKPPSMDLPGLDFLSENGRKLIGY